MSEKISEKINWSAIKIKATRLYRSNPRLKIPDRVEIVVDLPLKEYIAFRHQIDIPHLLRGRRSEDKISD